MEKKERAHRPTSAAVSRDGRKARIWHWLFPRPRVALFTLPHTTSVRPSARVRGVHDGPHPFPICFLTIKQGGLGKDHWLTQYFGASLVGRPW